MRALPRRHVLPLENRSGGNDEMSRAGAHVQRTTRTARQRSRAAQYSVVLLVSLSTILGIPVAESAHGQALDRQLCFYARQRLKGPGAGHAFVSFHPINNSQVGRADLVIGKWPGRWNFTVFGGGQRKHDVTEDWGYKICYRVSAVNYNKAAALANQNDNWSMQGDNCVDWAKDIALEAGITLPNTMHSLWGFLGLDDPEAFYQSLHRIFTGADSTPPGALVLPNLARTVEGGYPKVCSASGVVDAAFDDSKSLAGYLRLQHNLPAVPTSVNVRAGQTVTLTISNTSVTNALVAVDWGSGDVVYQPPLFTNPQREVNNTTPSHGFGATGTHVVKVIVIDAGAVNEFRVLVNVTDAAPAGPQSATVNVPNPPGNLMWVPMPTPPFIEDDSEPNVPATSEWLLGGAFVGLLVAGSLAARRRPSNASTAADTTPSNM